MTQDQKVIDWKLASQLANGNMKLAKELFNLLKTTLPEHIENLQKAQNENDSTALQKEAHKLHGAACYTGTPRLKEAAKTLELALQNKQTNEINDLYEILLKEIDAVLKAM